MDARLIYLFVFLALFFIIMIMDKKWGFVHDFSTVVPKPYSFARVQLVWWTFLVLSVMISTVIASGQIPDLNQSTLILLGIGSLTTISGRLIDLSDNQNQANAQAVAAATNTTQPAPLNQDLPSQGFFLDLLSDKGGVSVHRFQAFIFNLVFGVWFIYKSVKDLNGVSAKTSAAVVNAIIPVITDNNLILLGLSAGTYVALKTAENK